MKIRSDRGCFIVLEGLDGAGTTTQLHRISAALRERGARVHTTCEPSTGPVGTLLRQALTQRLRLPDGNGLPDETLALLFAADRMDHLAAELEPAMERGEIVLCDRYVLSSLAYQGVTLPMAWVEKLNARARTPDLTLFLKVNLATAAKRRAERGGEPELFDSKQAAISRRYDEAIALRGSAHRLVALDGSDTVEAITVEALKVIDNLLGTTQRRARAKR
ncbi:MAG: dTMP kinase [Myxococcaceae bacterium]